MDDARLTAPCGLYCGDCIPGDARLFSAARRLESLLDELDFGCYAVLKARAMPALREYGTFRTVLQAVTELECPVPCRDGGGKPACAVPACVAARSIAGCWQCRDVACCEPIDHLASIHPNLRRHHDLIRRHGLLGWSRHRGAHYAWQACAGGERSPCARAGHAEVRT
jgi:hypothetical protein